MNVVAYVPIMYVALDKRLYLCGVDQEARPHRQLIGQKYIF